VLGNLNIASGAKLSANLVADLTASIPRDVVLSAHQQWLPNLATEMANRPDAKDQKQRRRSSVITESRMVPTASFSPRAAGSEAHAEGTAGQTDPARAKADDGKQRLAADESGGATIRRWTLPSGTPRSIKARNKDAEKAAQPEGAAGKSDTETAKPEGAVSADAPADAPANSPNANAKPDGGKKALSVEEQPQDKAMEQTDDLLFPTEAELRAIKDPEKAAQPERAAGKADSENGAASADAASKARANAPADAPGTPDTAPAQPRTRAAPVISIASDVDPESWADYGGWYRQDYAIFYRPTGHKDKFVYAWLFLTGPQAPKGETSPAAAVFDFLTGKDAQGSCTKCHSVDDIRGKGRIVNFSPTSIESKQGRFTKFIHEPHFGILETRGCLTCHTLEKGRPYLKSYEQGDPRTFVSTFGAVKKDLCQTCHTSSIARQDCLLCHNYHVNGVVTPIISTKIPAQ
jgi:hypothetical protein